MKLLIMNPELVSIFSGPQSGGELPYFVGKQYGSGWLKTLGRFAIPILKRLGGAAFRTARDVITKDQPILPTLKSNMLSEASAIIPEIGRMMGGPARPQKRRMPMKRSINKRLKGYGTIFQK